MDRKISFVTNASKNTLDHIKLLLKSLKENLDNKEHEIIVFIDSDNEGIYDYLKSVKSQYYDLKIVSHKLKPCVGYSRNNNLLVELAKHDIVSYLQSDMVIGPHYDSNLLSELEDNCVLSSTRIEPPLHGYSNYTITENFGTDPNQFDMHKWNSYSNSVKSNRAAEYFFAPITFYKNVWQRVGGYDTLFRRSREDSDLVQRLVQSNIRLIQTWQANVYHFTCVSSRGKNWFDNSNDYANKRVELQKIADRIELRRFIRKWGNFNHGESKLTKFDIDLVVDGTAKLNVEQIVEIEPYFSRVWFSREEDRQKAINLTSKEHDPANELLSFSEKDWEDSKPYYNTTDYDSIYKVGEPSEYNIKIKLKDENVSPKNDMFFQYLNHISSIIESSEPGVYELGSAIIEIKIPVDINKDRIKAENPPFDISLLTIE